MTIELPVAILCARIVLKEQITPIQIAGIMIMLVSICAMNYYKVFLAKPDYLIKFWRSLAMCLMIAAGQTLFSCMSGTAFAKYSFPLN